MLPIVKLFILEMESCNLENPVNQNFGNIFILLHHDMSSYVIFIQILCHKLSSYKGSLT